MVKLARWTAWTLVAALVFVTLAPIELRPAVTGATIERAAAYGLLGLTFALAYPRHRLLALAAVVGVAGLLELGQVFTASRHGRVPDFAVKAVSAGLGVLGAHAALTFRAWRERRAARPG